MRRSVIWASATSQERGATAEIADYEGHRVGLCLRPSPPDPMRPVGVLHRDRFVDVDRATDLEDRASLCELDRSIEAVGRHDGVAG